MLSPVRLGIDPFPAGALTKAPFTLMLNRHLGLEDNNDMSELIWDLYLPSAVLWAEGVMHRAIISRVHKWIVRDFPLTVTQQIRLPRGKTQSVASVQYVANGTTTTLTGPSSGSPAGTDYQEDLSGEDGGIVMPLRGASWPSVDLDAPNPVIVNFTAGWLNSEIPADIVHAIYFAVTDGLELRGTADMADAGKNLDARMALVSPYALHRIYA